jgi:hypothetical protein
VVRQAGKELLPIARVHPPARIVAEVVTTCPRRQPDFMQGWLGIDHNLAAIGHRQFQQSPGAVGVDVHHVLLQPLVHLGFNGRQQRCGLLVILGIRKRRGCHEFFRE